MVRITISWPVVAVILPLPVEGSWSYRVPEEFRAQLRAGSRVLVPFGRRQLVGYVKGPGDTPAGTKLKSVLDLLDPEPLLDEDMLRFCGQLANYYACSTGEVLRAALPPGINGSARCYFSQQEDTLLRRPIRITPRRKRILQLVAERGNLSLAYLTEELGAGLQQDLNELVSAGFLHREERVEDSRRQAPMRRVLVPNLREGEERDKLLKVKERRAPRQADLLHELLKRSAGRLDRADATGLGFSSSVIRGLLDDGVVTQELEPDLAEDEYDQDHSVLQLQLTPQQQAVVERVSAKLMPHDRKSANSGESYTAFLLHGVTGSGKTQVYLELARRALHMGRGVLVLVPEIALTPQIVARFRSYLGNQVAVIHSRMTPARRFAIWQALRENRLRVVVGARSALFAPIRNLGLIVVDEEHETSFKQYDPAPRYHARDAAVLRARDLGIPVLLGSATPSLESWYNAQQGRYTLLELPERVMQRPLPSVELLDLRKFYDSLRGKGDTVRAFSDPLIEALLQVKERGEQAIILQNRRGHSTWLQCEKCGEALRCIRCDVSLVWHRSDRRAHCHLCGLSLPRPEKCPACGGEIAFLGHGTQKVEEELTEVLPDARLLRMDRDTTGERGAYVRMVREFNEGQYDILLGTQSVAKGLDFSRVTLVGVINADTELNLPDFRAHEWAFQLISQVAGRAGRGDTPGKVIVQTANPDSPPLTLAAAHDYRAFADGELVARRHAGYPPFVRLARLVLRSVKEEEAAQAALRLQHAAEDQGSVLVMKAGPAPVQFVRREYRHHLILKSPRKSDPAGRALRTCLRHLRQVFERDCKRTGLSLYIDVDPQGLM